MTHRRLRYKTGGHGDGKREMTIVEFLEKFDTNKDGLISQVELREAVGNKGGWFAQWKANRCIKSADANGNGIIDKDEISKLAEFAEKELNVRIVSY